MGCSFLSKMCMQHSGNDDGEVELDFSPFVDDHAAPSAPQQQRPHGEHEPLSERPPSAPAVQQRFVEDVFSAALGGRDDAEDFFGASAQKNEHILEQKNVASIDDGDADISPFPLVLGSQGESQVPLAGAEPAVSPEDWGPSLALGVLEEPRQASLEKEKNSEDVLVPQEILNIKSLDLGVADTPPAGDESDGPSFSSGASGDATPDFDPAHDQPTLATSNQVVGALQAPVFAGTEAPSSSEGTGELPLLGFQNMHLDSSLGRQTTPPPVPSAPQPPSSPLPRAAAVVTPPSPSPAPVVAPPAEGSAASPVGGGARDMAADDDDLPPMSAMANAVEETPGNPAEDSLGRESGAATGVLLGIEKAKAYLRKYPAIVVSAGFGIVTFLGVGLYDHFAAETSNSSPVATAPELPVQGNSVPLKALPKGEVRKPAKSGQKKALAEKQGSSQKISKKTPRQTAAIGQVEEEKNINSSVTLKAKSSQNSATPFARAPAGGELPHGLNQLYFETIDKALLAGGPEAAVRAFKRTRPAPLADEREKMLAVQLEVRYYLLVGQYEKARLKLANQCEVWSADNATLCIYYVRTLLNLGKHAEARVQLRKARDSTSEYEGLIEREWAVLQAAQVALATPSVPAATQLFVDLMQAAPLNSEWQRQRAYWFMKAVALLGRKERSLFSYQVFVNQRSPAHQVLRKALGERRIETLDDPLFAAFLRYLHFEAEGTLALPKVRSETQTDASLGGLLFAAVVDAPFSSPQKTLREVTSVHQHDRYKKIAKILEINLLINENDYQRAYGELLGVPKAEQSRYDWLLVQARLAMHQASLGLRPAALAQLEALLQRDASVATDFNGWMAVAKLRRMLKKPSADALQKANKYAVTLADFGYLALENIKILQSSGKLKEAHQLALASIRKIPHHGPLLQAAAEAASQVGASLSKIEVAQEQIPPHYWKRQHDLPLVTDKTLMDVILAQ